MDSTRTQRSEQEEEDARAREGGRGGRLVVTHLADSFAVVCVPGHEHNSERRWGSWGCIALSSLRRSKRAIRLVHEKQVHGVWLFDGRSQAVLVAVTWQK